MEDYNQKLDYNGLLLRHLDRMSQLSVVSTGKHYDDRMLQFFDNEDNKIKAFDFAIKILRTIVPTEFEDENFKLKISEITNTHNKNISKSTGSNYLLHTDFRYLKACINLLSRKGMLIENNGFIDTIPKKFKKPTEEWDK